MKKIYFVTSNVHKLSEANEIGRRYDILFEKIDVNVDEIRSESIEEIAKQKAIKSYEIVKKPIVVEDTGIFIECLQGFPGTYSAYVEKKIKNAGILKLMDDCENRKAKFISCVVLYDGKTLKIFNGECNGEIAKEERGKYGFGYDPIFIPIDEKNVKKQTFGENFELKKMLSHRTKAFEKFCEFYVSSY